MIATMDKIYFKIFSILIKNLKIVMINAQFVKLQLLWILKIFIVLPVVGLGVNNAIRMLVFLLEKVYMNLSVFKSENRQSLFIEIELKSIAVRTALILMGRIVNRNLPQKIL